MDTAGKIHKYAERISNTYSFLVSGVNIGIKYLIGQDVTVMDFASLAIDAVVIKESSLSEEKNWDSFKKWVKSDSKSKNLKAVNKLDDVAKGVKSGNPSNKVLGGSFKDVDASRGANEVGHHLPQNAYNVNELGMTRNEGPALLMTKEDHALTRTYRGRGKQTMISDKGLNAR